MRIDEVRTLTTDQLKEELDKTYKELFTLRFQKATRRLADSTAIPKARKTVARIQTVLTERTRAEQG
ncbi:MAG: 50S ribosomal protein L29 [Verrucomicrobia bacterium]|nr:50S ribosomal protein L29 [Verrucomicrobiota bacterium]